jgi:hypothetical protein
VPRHLVRGSANHCRNKRLAAESIETKGASLLRAPCTFDRLAHVVLLPTHLKVDPNGRRNRPALVERRLRAGSLLRTAYTCRRVFANVNKARHRQSLRFTLFLAAFRTSRKVWVASNLCWTSREHQSRQNNCNMQIVCRFGWIPRLLASVNRQNYLGSDPQRAWEKTPRVLGRVLYSFHEWSLLILRLLFLLQR